MTKLDPCETNQELAHKVNVEGTENIIQGCKLNNSKLVYISTDFVFDGKKGDYKEEDITNPLSCYGKTKLEAEELVKRSGMNISQLTGLLTLMEMKGKLRNLGNMTYSHS